MRKTKPPQRTPITLDAKTYAEIEARCRKFRDVTPEMIIAAHFDTAEDEMDQREALNNWLEHTEEGIEKNLGVEKCAPSGGPVLRLRKPGTMEEYRRTEQGGMNPIEKLIRESMEKKGVKGVVLKDLMRDESLAKLFADLPDLKRKLGTLVIDACTSGDLNFAETVRKAVKSMDAVFHRNLEFVLLEKVLRFIAKDPRFAGEFNSSGPKPKGVKEAREIISTECNNGMKLKEMQWRRIRAAMNLQYPAEKVGRKVGRPAAKKSRKG